MYIRRTLVQFQISRSLVTHYFMLKQSNVFYSEVRYNGVLRSQSVACGRIYYSVTRAHVLSCWQQAEKLFLSALKREENNSHCLHNQF